MEAAISVQDVANIITFVAPGYFAVKTYAAVYAKPDKDFSQTLLISVVCSLPIVAAYSWIFNLDHIDTNVRQALGLIIFSVAVGLASSWLRQLRPVKRLTRLIRFPAADEDFLKLQFAKLSRDEVVLVRLRSGEIFSGTPQGANKYQASEPRRYLFTNVAWFVKKTGEWEGHGGDIIIGLDDIEYFETPRVLPED